ncbi:MAG: HU family DNA-binding protein [Candidatus Electrothrix sp. AX5]|nr:HU family DNA-binding protein [Candidatus Electrothrix sp. AX5]
MYEGVIRMTKKDIVEEVASEAKITKAAAERAINALTALIRQDLKKGNEITLTGLGKFYIKRKTDTHCMNPKTGELIEIPTRGTVKFTPGKHLKESL